MPDTNYEAEKLEAQKRFEALPETLKKEILADKNAELVSSICRDYSIPEDKVKHVTLLVGEVFLGYTKPEEIAHELTSYFDIDLQKANFIEIELKQKLFNGLKTELDKIYNPLSAEALAKEDVKTTEEIAPSIIKLEIGEQFTTSGQQQKAPPLTIGNIPAQPQPSKIEIPATPKTIPEQAAKEEMPFIIHTNVEAVKAATPQFPKETPSLNLKVDPSIIQKNPIIKPVSVHLETAQPIQEKRFQMPVIAGQKIFSSAPAEKIAEKPLTTASSPIETNRSSAPMAKTILSMAQKIETKPLEVKLRESGPTNLQGKPMEPQKNPENVRPSLTETLTAGKIATPPKKAPPIFEEINIPIQQKTIPVPSQPISSPSLKQISEQKIEPSQPVMPEPAKVVHYSTFKTDLNTLGTPKKPEPKKEDFINLNTFMKVSGNTVDLRSKSSNNE